jgi:hypothetical protein
MKEPKLPSSSNYITKHRQIARSTGNKRIIKKLNKTTNNDF